MPREASLARLRTWLLIATTSVGFASCFLNPGPDLPRGLSDSSEDDSEQGGRNGNGGAGAAAGTGGAGGIIIATGGTGISGRCGASAGGSGPETEDGGPGDGG